MRAATLDTLPAIHRPATPASAGKPVHLAPAPAMGSRAGTPEVAVAPMQAVAVTAPVPDYREAVCLAGLALQLAQVVLQRLYRAEEPVEATRGGHEGEVHSRVDVRITGRDTNGQLSVQSRADGDQELECLIHDPLSRGEFARLDVIVLFLVRVGQMPVCRS